MVVINKTRRPYSVQQILEVSSELIGVLALALLLTFSLVGGPWPWQALAASATVPFVINIMYMSHTLRRLRTEFSSSESRISSKLDVYSEILRRLTHGKDVRFIEILETPYDFYHALNTARELSSKTVRVMKLHHLGPQDANHDLQLKQTSTPQVLSETMTEMDAWYNGLRKWAGQRGRLVERISACPSKSMKEFILQTQHDMEGLHTYTTFYLGMAICLF